VPKVDWKAIHEEVADLTAKHARQTGAAISAWNLLQDTLGRIFAEIVDPANQKLALAIWYSQESDRAQRKMLKAAVKARYGEASKIWSEIKYLCTEADTIAEHRNNVVHVGYSVDLDITLTKVGIKPRGLGVYRRADAMENKDVLLALEALEKSCKDLFQFAAMLTPMIFYPEQEHTWPDRPELPKGPGH
jgi:hypothetical protein